MSAPEPDKRIRALGKLPRIAPHCSRLRVHLEDQDREAEMRMLPEGAGEEHRRVFDQELEELLGLDHPSFLPVLETGVSRERPYYLVPLREYVPLARRRKEERFSVEERCLVARALSAALAEAHQRRMILGPPSPVVLAWERLKPQLTFAHHRVPAEVKALPLAEGSPGGLERPVPANDVFHWAYFSYWLITRGQFPYKGSGPPRPLRAVVPELAPDLAQVIDAALARDPALRPAHGVEVLAVLLRRPANRAATPEPAGEDDATEVIQLDLKALRGEGAIPELGFSGVRPPVSPTHQEAEAGGDLPMPAPRLVAAALLLALLVGGLLALAGGGSGEPVPGGDGRVHDASRPPPPGKDPFLRLLLGKREVSPADFPRLHRMATKLADLGRLPGEGLDLEALRALGPRAETDLPGAARGLELWLEDLRAVSGNTTGEES